MRHTSRAAITLALFAASCGSGGATGTSATAAPTAASATTMGSAATYADGQPGSCRILEEKYCSLGEMVYFENGTPNVAFSLPAGTPLFAFGAGNAVEMLLNPLGPGRYDPDEEYRAVHIMSTNADDTDDVLMVFENVSGEPDVHLATVEEGDVIGSLTAETLRVLSGGLQSAEYNLLIQFFDAWPEPDGSAFESYFGLTP